MATLVIVCEGKHDASELWDCRLQIAGCISRSIESFSLILMAYFIMLIQPVCGPLERVGVHIMELAWTQFGNCYVSVFLEYFTKWVEVYLLPNQTSLTVARVLVNQVICPHGGSHKLLSDRSAGTLSQVTIDVCQFIGMTKVNTTAYHLQTDGLVQNLIQHLIELCCQYWSPIVPSSDLSGIFYSCLQTGHDHGALSGCVCAFLTMWAKLATNWCYDHWFINFKHMYGHEYGKRWPFIVGVADLWTLISVAPEFKTLIALNREN